jgi:hypothetical protein
MSDSDETKVDVWEDIVRPHFVKYERRIRSLETQVQALNAKLNLSLEAEILRLKDATSPSITVTDAMRDAGVAEYELHSQYFHKHGEVYDHTQDVPNMVITVFKAMWEARDE